jgi:hypothetical protein
VIADLGVQHCLPTLNDAAIAALIERAWAAPSPQPIPSCSTSAARFCRGSPGDAAFAGRSAQHQTNTRQMTSRTSPAGVRRKGDPLRQDAFRRQPLCRPISPLTPRNLADFRGPLATLSWNTKLLRHLLQFMFANRA